MKDEHHTAIPVSGAGPLPADWLGAVLRFIESHLDARLSLGDLARVAHISPFHFARLFKQSTGVTVHQYIIKRRVVRSRQLLEVGDLSVAQVAAVVGFADQSHLTRHFKRHFGLTPRQVAARPRMH